MGVNVEWGDGDDDGEGIGTNAQMGYLLDWIGDQPGALSGRFDTILQTIPTEFEHTVAMLPKLVAECEELLRRAEAGAVPDLLLGRVLASAQAAIAAEHSLVWA